MLEKYQPGEGGGHFLDTLKSNTKEAEVFWVGNTF